MSSWSLFYTGTATAAATLMGLLFVAVSVGASANISARQEMARALSEQALANLLTTLTISLVALIPALSVRSFGEVAFALSGLPTVLTAWRLVSLAVRSKERGRLVALRRHGASLLAFAMLLFAAASLAAGPDHLVLLAASLLLLISSATMSAWELLLTIGRPRVVEDI